ncbi:MAG: flagellar hook-associated protein FlgK [Deltaproteobacteria bacterium]|nr:flagellar hook-associated protein FlgK [Deltaproteobacteria bacterium]
MANYTAKILNNSTGALAAQQAVIAATSNNIANVNTPGYTRRIVELQTRTSRGEGVGVNVGNGVEVGNLNRISDSFLEGLVRSATGDKSSYQIQSDLLSRIDNLFSLTGSAPTIGSSLTSFFGAVDDLTANPSSIPLRATMLDKANDLVTSIRTAYNTVASVQEEANQRIGTEISTVNSITAQIAIMNGRIRANESMGSIDGDNRDQRDVLMQKLAEKIDYNAVELPDGSVNIALANGFTLVTGTQSRDLGFTATPSFAGGSAIPASLSGGNLGYITYNYGDDSSPAHIDLTRVLGAGSGSIGGLLAVRGYNAPGNDTFQADGICTAVASRIEAVTRTLLGAVNTSYLGPDLVAGGTHQPSTVGLNGASSIPGVYGLFDFQFSGNKDANNNGLPDDVGVTGAHSGVSNYSSLLTVAITDPADIAAAVNTGTIATPIFSPGDGTNMETLAALKDTNYTFALGSVSTTGTFNDAYAETVGYVGNTKKSVDIQRDVASDSLVTAMNSRDEVSGVSLDEEFSSLIKFQKAYQASAKMIKVAENLLDQIVSLL